MGNVVIRIVVFSSRSYSRYRSTHHCGSWIYIPFLICKHNLGILGTFLPSHFFTSTFMQGLKFTGAIMFGVCQLDQTMYNECRVEWKTLKALWLI